MNRYTHAIFENTMNNQKPFSIKVKPLALAFIAGILTWGQASAALAKDNKSHIHAKGVDSHQEHEQAVAGADADEHVDNASDSEIGSEDHSGSSDGHDHEVESGDGHDHEAESGDGHDHEAESGDGHSESAPEPTKLTSKQQALAGVVVSTLTPRVMDYQVYAPGEIKANGYSSYVVSPRLDSVVSQRYVTLGEHVEQGQKLITLFSESMADAQALYLSSQAEWTRVRSLGKAAVGAKRFVQAQTSYRANMAKLIAFGMSNEAINELVNGKSHVLGEYSLVAAVNGVVLNDDFNQGQRVSAGSKLMTLVNETELWVEARLPANSQLALSKGNQALVTNGIQSFPAQVVQEAHTIDPQTRTRIVRLSVENTTHRLHPGMFTDVYFQFKTDRAVLAVPETALMRGADGDWTVFVEVSSGTFRAVEVELGQALGQWRLIDGIPPGSRVVTQGAFFVSSEIAKGGFDPHNH